MRPTTSPDARDDLPILLTVKEVAAMLRVCKATVYSMVERGELSSVRASNAIRIVVHPGERPVPGRYLQRAREGTPASAGRNR